MRRGRRECRALAATHGPPAEKSWRQSPQVQPNIRHSLRDELRLIRGLLSVPGLLANVACGTRRARMLSASVGAPGQHDFAVHLAAVRLTARCDLASPPHVS